MDVTYNSRAAQKDRTPIIEPLALPIAVAVAVSGLSRSAIYREAGAGQIKLLKLGRSTLVEMASVRALLSSLPAARIRAPKRAA
jgi:hypothetical protein